MSLQEIIILAALIICTYKGYTRRVDEQEYFGANKHEVGRADKPGFVF